MSPSAISLITILAIVSAGTGAGFVAGARRKTNLEQWTIGDRSFGPLFVFLLLAGENYTTFALLGASGWAYSRGGPALYIIAYSTLGYIVSFFVLPEICTVGRQYGMQTQPDFFALRYGNRSLAAFVCAVGVVFLIPYLQLQVVGLGLIVSIASFGGVGRISAMIIAVSLLVGFVFVGGIRAVARVSVSKDLLMLLVALAVGIGIPYLHFGGIGPMFSALSQIKPSHLTMPGSTTDLGHSWYISTVLLTSLGFYMWPHTFATAFAAKDPYTLRRNAGVMPLYTLTLAFIFFAGFATVPIPAIIPTNTPLPVARLQ